MGTDSSVALVACVAVRLSEGHHRVGRRRGDQLDEWQLPTLDGGALRHRRERAVRLISDS